MQDVDHRLVAFVTWLAGTAAVLVTLVVPLSYFSLSFSALSSATQATAMIESEMAEQIISSLPDLWKYQTVRLDQALARHAQHMGLQRVVIVDLRNDVVAEHGRHPPWPVLSRSIELFESGTAVGRLEVSFSLRGILVETGVAGLVGLLLGTFLYVALRTMPLRVLNRTFESLRSSLQEKEVLLKEIHHRVKNNLQIIISLMRLESRAFSEERLQAVLKDLETRIRAMALVHEHLYHSSDLTKIGFKDYLKGLCEELFRTYGADSGRIRLEIDAEAVALDIERAIPCGLIINELLTNAIKHAFPGNRKGVLRVAIRDTPDNEVEILVSDDGIGIPETLDIRHAESLGLQLVFTLAENQLKGRVELERASGTQFRIRFRL